MRKKLLAIASTAFTVVAGLGLVASPVQAVTFGDHFVFDNFSHLDLRPDPDAYWHTLNWGDENGLPMIWTDQLCGDGSCFEIKGSGFNKYLRLSIFPDSTSGFYSNAELAERNTGFATTEPGKYLPSIGHPVIITARVRFSANYNADGSGTNIGSAGLWMWNSPFDATTYEYGYTESFGFVMATGADNFIIPGFAVTQSNPSQFPNYVQTIRDLDIHNWLQLSMVWSQVDANNQKVKYYVNDEQVGETTFANFGALDLEVWQDNQTLDAENFEIIFPSPTEVQYMDIDFITVVDL